MKRLVLGISGASGQIYAVQLLRALQQDIEVHTIFSQTAVKIMKQETGWDPAASDFAEFLQSSSKESLDRIKIIDHDAADFFAPVSSGSFKTEGMVVAPCSAKTLSGIANGYTNTLIERAADVTLKEKRPLILVLRECPYNQIHIKNMLQASQAGAVILPASPAFYQNPQTIEDLADFVVSRILNILNIPQNIYPGWREDEN